MAPRSIPFVLAVLMWSAACSSSPTDSVISEVTGEAPRSEDLGTDSRLPADQVTLSETRGETPGDPTDFGSLDVSADMTPLDAPETSDGFRMPCTGHADCPSGICLSTGTGAFCTIQCYEDCPENWTCAATTIFGTDPVLVCVPDYWYICAPCDTAVECKTAGSYCVGMGSDGKRCTVACGPDGECPGGFACTLESDGTGVCAPDSGSCLCRLDEDEGVVHECLTENAFGACPGSKTCLGAEGWTPCDGPEPKEEACNGLDDNCDGSTDEPFADLDQDLVADCMDPDDDGDAVPDDADNCPKLANLDQLDQDQDGIGDACDSDADGDDVPDVSDNCPGLANTDQLNTDGDTMGDACDPDDDNDSVGDGQDNCPLVDNVDQADLEGDKIGDVCDPDDDNDGTDDTPDNCPVLSNPDQADMDGDKTGDACDDDDDGDGVPDFSDNCPGLANPLQPDLDQDSVGDACDLDDDNDAVPDLEDNCPLLANADQSDCDSDGEGDSCDVDDDSDGVVDDADCGPCDPSVFPGAIEACNAIDDNCNSLVDEDVEALCAPYTCGGAAGCSWWCDDEHPCVPGTFCDLNDNNGNGKSDECIPQLPTGQKCAAAFECQTQYCANGFCCGSVGEMCCAASPDCSFLDAAAVCDAPASCTGHRTEGYCNEASVCKSKQVADAAGCAGSLCSPGKYCSGTSVRQDVFCNASGGCAVDGNVVQGCMGSNPCCDYGCSNAACYSAFRSGDLGCLLACAYQPVVCFCW